MEWQKSEFGQIWHWSNPPVYNPSKAVIHCNEYTRYYDVAIRYAGGPSVSAQGLRTLEEAQEWVRLMV